MRKKLVKVSLISRRGSEKPLAVDRMGFFTADIVYEGDRKQML